MKLSDIYPPKGRIQSLVCDECDGPLDLVFEDFHEEVSGVDIAISGLPYLRCAKCGEKYLPDNSRFAIIRLHEETVVRSTSKVKVTRRPSDEKFNFAKVDFIYSADDYRYIPGLERPWNLGFLTPVFFNKAVLLKYDALPEYQVKFASTTYGTIYSENFYISFGINKNGKVIMWLGDLAALPEKEQYYLRSENVPSDHAVASEFYDGQIDVQFTKRSVEDELFGLRSEFISGILAKLGLKIAHLDNEVIEISVGFNPPLVDTSKERRHVADALNKIYVESWDSTVLGKAIAAKGGDPKGLGTLKRLQMLLELLAPSANISSLMSPLFVLYDFRVAASHLTSREAASEIMQKVTERLTLPESADLQTTYARLLEELSKTFRALVELFPSPKE
jgi:YgiT-type zinc finger domain-containing protein